MSRKHKKERLAKPNQGTRPRKSQSPPQPSANTAFAVFIAGIALLLVSIGASFMLVLDHFGAMALPGCGAGSACANLTGSVWGKVPLIGWPMSFVGLAWFIAVLSAWIITRGMLGTPARLFIWMGAIASVLFISVMGVHGEVCWYCLAAHVGNLGFVALMEAARPAMRSASSAPAPVLRPIAPAAAAFAIVTIGLLGWQAGQKQAIAERAETDLEASMEQMLAAAGPQNQSESRAAQTGRGFTGRYVYGPQNAPIRLVIFSSYQCIDCQRIEAEVQEMLAQRSDVSLSVKHFPMSNTCNRHMSDRNPHPNSCWAARAAEAAGIIGGEDRYWEMHKWLFEVKGSFTQPVLRAALANMGYNVEQFLSIMQSEQTLRLVQEDIEEAVSLGLMFTPFIFINGVELRGWTAPNAVNRAVERLAAQGVTPGTYADDEPVDAFQKHIDDWREGYRRHPHEATPGRMDGPAPGYEAEVRIDLWGDYLHDLSAEADAAIRARIAGASNVRYTFRHYPGSEECNPHVSRTIDARACRAAYAAEAAAQLGGITAYRRMHDWMLANRESFNDDLLRSAAPSLGFDPDELFAAMNREDVKAAVYADADVIPRLNARGRPLLLINEKWVPRWKLEGHDVLGAILEEAGMK